MEVSFARKHIISIVRLWSLCLVVPQRDIGTLLGPFSVSVRSLVSVKDSP